MVCNLGELNEDYWSIARSMPDAAHIDVLVGLQWSPALLLDSRCVCRAGKFMLVLLRVFLLCLFATPECAASFTYNTSSS